MHTHIHTQYIHPPTHTQHWVYLELKQILVNIFVLSFYPATNKT